MQKDSQRRAFSTGVDNQNDYYDVSLKKDRETELKEFLKREGVPMKNINLSKLTYQKKNKFKIFLKNTSSI